MIKVGFTSPAPGSGVGPTTFTVTGSWIDDGAPDGVFDGFRLLRVLITFPAVAGSVHAALNEDTKTWSAELTLPADTHHGEPVTVTLTATVERTSTEHPDQNGEGGIPPDPSHTLNLVAKRIRTRGVTIESFPSPVTPATLPYRLELAGTVGDTWNKITKVQLKVNTADPVDVDVEPHDRIWFWRKPLVLPAAAQYTFTVLATFGDAAPMTKTVTKTAVLSIDEQDSPAEVEHVFAPTRYLLELARNDDLHTGFAARYVRVNGAPKVLTPAMLAERFHQPFDQFIIIPSPDSDSIFDPRLYELAMRTVPQARIAVEVLRATLADVDVPALAKLDRDFRGMAYEALLGELGTSYQELARTAQPPARKALAARLGIELLPAGPDRLAELTKAPETISDTDLETLFGYQSTARKPDAPLRAEPDAARLVLWQRDALSARWQREDEEQRDSHDPQPIIDPDVIGPAHFLHPEPDDPAFKLQTDRQKWITTEGDKIRGQAQIGATALVRFDGVVSMFVDEIDLAELAGRDADGEDISRALADRDLDLDAFRLLARSRAVLTEHPDAELLDTEIDDVVSILLQVQKRRLFLEWRRQERDAGLVLAPSSFKNPDEPDTGRPANSPSWQSRPSDYTQWRRVLTARTAQYNALDATNQLVIAAAEARVLPALRDELVATLAAAGEDTETAGERLTRELFIDLRTTSGQRTTRVDQALETLLGMLFSIRSGRLAADPWTIGVEASEELHFDLEWRWMGSFGSWLAATRVFAYPENQLFPALYVTDETADPPLTPTGAFSGLLTRLRDSYPLTPDGARQLAVDYLTGLRGDWGALLSAELNDPTKFEITEQRSNKDLVALQTLSRDNFVAAAGAASDVLVRLQLQREIFWLVPMALAGKLQQAGQFPAALDWYQTVYAYHLPPANRKIYHGLTAEEATDSTTLGYTRYSDWTVAELNPHIWARNRRNCYTRATIMAIADCLNAFADAEFARTTVDGNARGRTLYETAADLLGLDDAKPETGRIYSHDGKPFEIPFPENPVWRSLRVHARSGLTKIHHGLNIAGSATVDPNGESVLLPSQYRYITLIERAKNLVTIAQQVEAAYLAAVQQGDTATLEEMRAGHELAAATSTLTMQDLKIADADVGLGLATLQRERAQLQRDHYHQILNDGLNRYETAGLHALYDAAALHAAAGVASMYSFKGLAESGSGFISEFAAAASTLGGALETQGSYERRALDWQLQRDAAAKDYDIGTQQMQLAENQRKLANQERELAGQQMDHAQKVAQFLATRLLTAELYEWMSGVLGRVYAYFLQQATALAQLAEAQLAFERQELAAGLIGADYWRDSATNDTPTANTPDRRGLTGSARLLRDTERLDLFAFDTDRRKLQVTQTFALSQIAAFELQLFRETGLLTVATPQKLFDREFPGHYLRLIKRVRISLIALVPPVRGVRATLSASGVSRTVVARGPFDTVTLRRQPESIAFTAPINATGLFELEPESGLLVPFEGMGVDAVWQLELPKAANPFDYTTIADVLLTIDYTALDSPEYRQRVIRDVGRRFSGDRTFGLRDQYPDVWYALSNPDTVENPQHRMRAAVAVTPEDLPRHIEDLRVAELTLFVVRKPGLADELTISSLDHTTGGQTISAGEMRTTGGIISTRRPAGTAWRQAFADRNPVGDWEIQLQDNPKVRSWFRDGLIEDLVLVLTLSGTTPEWP